MCTETKVVANPEFGAGLVSHKLLNMRLTVKDGGVGMTAQQQSLLFTPYTQVRELVC